MILFSFWFVIFPAYLYFSILDNSDLAAPYPCFKNGDQEDSILSPKKKEKILESTFSIEHIFLDHLSLAQVSHPSFRPRLLKSKSLILRCWSVLISFSNPIDLNLNVFLSLNVKKLFWLSPWSLGGEKGGSFLKVHLHYLKIKRDDQSLRETSGPSGKRLKVRWTKWRSSRLTVAQKKTAIQPPREILSRKNLSIWWRLQSNYSKQAISYQ